MRQGPGIPVADIRPGEASGVEQRPLSEPNTGAISEDERRQYRRMNIRVPVELQAPRESRPHIVRTLTQNVSTGGFYIESDAEDFAAGEVLDVALTLPAAEGVSSYPTRARTRAVVLRVDSLDDRSRSGIAARFVERLRMG